MYIHIQIEKYTSVQQTMYKDIGEISCNSVYHAVLSNMTRLTVNSKNHLVFCVK